MPFGYDEDIDKAAQDLAANDAPRESTTPKGDPVDQAARELYDLDRERQKARFNSYELGETSNPEQAAESERLARKYGVPRAVVETDPSRYRLRESEERLNLLRSTSPQLVKWMDNRDNYALARDDVENLSAIESFLSAAYNTPGQFYASGRKMLRSLEPQVNIMNIEQPAREWKRTSEVSATAMLSHPAASAYLTNEQRQKLVADTQAQQEKTKAKITDYLRDVDPEIRRNVAVLERVLEDYRKQAPQAPNSTVQGYYSGLDSAVQMTPGIVASILTRSAAPGVMFAGANTYMQEYGTAKIAGADFYKADQYATAQANIEMATEMLPFHVLFGRENIGKDYVKRWFQAQVAEGFGEQLATLGQDYNNWKFLNPDKTAEEFLAERPDAAYQTLIATLTVSGPMSAVSLTAEKMMVDAAEKARQAQMSPGDIAIENAMKAAKNSKLAKRSPEKFEEAVDAMAKESGIDKVSVDLDGVVEALNQKGVDPGAVLEALGVDREQAEADGIRFGETQVDLAKVMAAPAVREHLTDIQPHLRSPKDDYTPAQKQKIRDNFGNEIKDRLEMIRAAAEGKAELSDREMQAADLIRQRVEGANIFGERVANESNADVAVALNSVLAGKMGMDPVEFFEQHFSRIQMSVDGMVKEQRGETKKARSARHKAEREALDAEFNDINELSELRGDVENTYARIKSGEVSEEAQRLLPEREARLRELEARKAEWEQKHLDLLKRQKAEREGSTQEGVLTQQQESVDQGDQTSPGQNEAVEGAGKPDSKPLPQQESKDRHRAQYDTIKNIITLFEGRNISTLIHELSHWYLFKLEEFANLENAPEGIRQEWEAIRGWYEQLKADGKLKHIRDRYSVVEENGAFVVYYKGPYDRDSQRLSNRMATREAAEATIDWREMHETWAESFEVYMQTNQAPSLALRRAFRVFNSWLTQMWNNLRTTRKAELERANLNPEIVAIFDRMLATEQQIEAASMQAKIEAETVAGQFLKQGILTQKEYERAVKRLPEIIEEVKEELRTQLMADLRREDEAWWRTERERIKADKTRSFDTSPVGRALNWLGLGAYKGDVPVEESPGEAARADVEALYQSAARNTLDDQIREAEQNNAEVDQEIKTVREMLNEAAACAAGVAPASVGQMVAGIGLATGAGIPMAIIATQMTPQAQAERERRMKEWNLQEHQRLMRENPEYRQRHEQYNARRQAEYDNVLAEYRAARQFEQQLEAYSDIDNMPADSQFDMNSWTEQVSGVSGEFLDDLIGHEAAGDWNAEAGTSTAKGGGQFIDSTWLRLMRQHGPELGLDPGMSKEDMLALRTDRRWGTMMTAYYAMENRAALEKKLDRPVTQKDAYLAHFLGASAAAKALTMDQAADAAKAFPAAAEANQNVFYKYGNPENPRTVGEMIERQTKGFSAEPLMVWDYPQMIGEADDGRVDR